MKGIILAGGKGTGSFDCASVDRGPGSGGLDLVGIQVRTGRGDR
jgi:hypothetical protein